MLSLKPTLFFSLLALTLLNPVQAAIKSEFIDYQIDGQAFRGYLSYDDALTGKRPGVLVVHEWWGHNAYARKRAEMLAAQGYTALALDMYGTGKLADPPKTAGQLMNAVLADMPAAEQRFTAAKALLQQQDSVDPNKIAAIGYCFGGGIVLHMARQGDDLAAVASFHGSLATQQPAVKGAVKARVLVFNGADDPFVKAEHITALKQEMTTAEAVFEFINYPGVKHSFTNPEADRFGQQYNLPLVYDAAADNDSWQRMLTLFSRIFSQQ